MKYGFVMMLALMLGACASQKPMTVRSDVEAPKVRAELPLVYDESSIISNKALSSFKEKYSEASTHKAFAQSESGAWSWKSNRTSREHAVRSALIACADNNERQEEAYPCVVINIDGVWVDNR